MRRLFGIVFSAVLLLMIGAPGAWPQKVYNLGHYPGGTWAGFGDINDFGLAVGTGDVADGTTHTLAVPVFGKHAGEWMDLGALEGGYVGWEEPLNKASDTGIVVSHSYN